MTVSPKKWDAFKSGLYHNINIQIEFLRKGYARKHHAVTNLSHNILQFCPSEIKYNVESLQCNKVTKSKRDCTSKLIRGSSEGRINKLTKSS